MNDTASLSPSLQDYLEVVFHLAAAKQVARVKDIARQVNVKNSSVTGALRSLAEKTRNGMWKPIIVSASRPTSK